MRLEDIKIDDMLYYVDVEFGEYEILEVFVEQKDEETTEWCNVKCKISSDDERINDKVIIVNENELFETRKEALECALEKTMELQNSYKNQVVRATIELEEENRRVEALKEKEEKRTQIFGKVINLWGMCRNVCKHPGYSLMFMEDFNNEEFLKALELVCDTFAKNIEKQDEGAERLLKAIFGEENLLQGE